jgi:protein tyrosine kinase modulator
MQPIPMTPKDYVKIFKRRKWCLILTFLAIFLISALVALLLPSIYQSTATILIEEQDIPQDYVMTTVTSYAEQRLQTINQRIMSFSRLLEIIQRFDMYPELRNKWTSEEIVEKMRKDTVLEPVSAEVVDRRTGKPTTATIAFTLSYQGKNPSKVQQVANVLTSLFLQENLQVREKQAQETSAFLEGEMDKVKTDLADTESKIAAYKEEHINELPELLQVNLQSLNNIERSIERTSENLRSLKERERYLETQLAGIPRYEDTPEELAMRQRLEQLKAELVSLQTRFSDEHPDVIKTKAEIADLEKKPAQAARMQGKSSSARENPTYVTLAAQLASTRTEMQALTGQLNDLNKAAVNYRTRIEDSPRVEEAYKAIIIERDNLKAKYDDLMRKHMEAKVAFGLEKEQKGERFTLIEPPRLPEKPFKPNRLAIMLIGIVLGIGAGVGFAAVREFSDDAVRDSDSLTFATKLPVLVGIPEIVTQADITRRRFKWVTATVATLVVILAGIVVFHYQVMDLDVFWARLMRKLAL